MKMGMHPDRATQLWQESFRINRSFLDLRPIYPVARRLALNAEVASAHLGAEGTALNVVMREVGVMTTTLSELVESAEAIFQALVRLVAQWILLDARLLVYQRSVDAARARRGAPPLRWKDALTADAITLWRDLAAEAPAAERPLWAALIQTRAELAAVAREVIDRCRALARIVERVSWVATRQTQYLATVASVETRRIGEASVISLSDRLVELSLQIAAVDRGARDSIAQMTHIGGAIAAALRGGR